MYHVEEMLWNPPCPNESDGPKYIRLRGHWSETRRWRMDVLPKDVVIIMQWTGKKDKHGVKIFEGDILDNEEIIGNIYQSEEYVRSN